MGVIRMKRRKLGVLFLIILWLSMTLSTTFAYSDDLFEFDMPDNYEKAIYQDMYAFTDTTNEDRGFIIYARENRNIKKSAWDINQI